MDPVTQALASVSARSPYAALFVFAAGAVTSIGPCVAPRFIAVSGIAAGPSRARAYLLVASFTAGLTATYAAFGAISTLLAHAVAFSYYTYAAVAGALAISGFAGLWRDQSHCTHTFEGSSKGEGGGFAFLLGASLALVVSPCCTPLVAGILAYTAASANSLYASELLACFALGHSLPLIGLAFGMQRIAELLTRHTVRQAAAVVSATLMLGLAGYYAVLV